MMNTRRYNFDEIKKVIRPVKPKSRSQNPNTIKSNGSKLVEKINNALDFIDPDCSYDQWLGIGMAIYSELPDSEGLDLYDKWSAKGNKYFNGEPDRKWDSFGSSYAGDQITIGTLFWYAHKAGWENTVHRYSSKELEFAIANLSTDGSDEVERILASIHHSKLNPAVTSSLLKKIKKSTGIGIGDLRNSLKNILDSTNPTTHSEWAKATIKKIGAENLLYCNSYFYLWSDPSLGVWSKSNERKIKQHIHTVIEESIGKKYRKSDVDSVIDLVKTEQYIDNHQFNVNKNIINTSNCELIFHQGTWQQKDHDRLNYSTSQIPVDYDSKAKAPKFKKFLNQVFKGDKDRIAKIKIILEMIGYSLLPTTKFEKFIILIGTGANGKSVLLGILEALLGRKNVCAIQPSQLDNKFQRGHLDGKLANIVTEIAEGTQIADAQLKAIVSGELTTAEHKNRDPFEFHPVASCWFGTNHMPHTRDFSEALFRRALIIDFPNKFEGLACDPNLKDKLLQELPGILNMALSAVGNVLTQGTFTSCNSMDNAKAEWRLEADQVAQFMRDCCIKDPKSSVDIGKLYFKYKEWTFDSGIHLKLNKNNFGKRLNRLGIQKKRTTGGVWIRVGIKFQDI